MTANRIIPFGYRMAEGQYAILLKESKEVLRIFQNYVNGASLLSIAQTLTAEAVEFIPGRSDWNKNRVKRILEDSRYCGNATYPAIVGGDVFRQIQAVRHSKSTHPTPRNPHVRPLSRPVICGACGAKMTRRHAANRKLSQDMWICKSCEHGLTVNVNDADLLAELTTLLNRLITNPDLIKTDPASPEISPEVRRLTGEVNQQLDAPHFDRESAQTAIFQLAAERFRATGDAPAISHMLQKIFAEQPPLSAFDAALFKRVTDHIRFDANGALGLVLKNQQIIQRSETHADGNDHTTA